MINQSDPINLHAERQQLTSLLALAAVDNHLDPRELLLIRKIGKQLGMTRTELDETIEAALAGNYELPTQEAKCHQHLLDLILLMMADGRIEQSEIEFCESTASRFGFSRGTVKAIITQIERQQLLSHFSELVLMAQADGDFCRLEKRFFIELSKKFPISRTDMENVLSQPQKIPLFPPVSWGHTLLWIVNIGYMMLMDGEITDNELSLFKKFCKNRQITEKTALAIINEIKEGRFRRKDTAQLTEELLEKFPDPHLSEKGELVE